MLRSQRVPHDLPRHLRRVAAAGLGRGLSVGGAICVPSYREAGRELSVTSPIVSAPEWRRAPVVRMLQCSQLCQDAPNKFPRRFVSAHNRAEMGSRFPRVHRKSTRMSAHVLAALLAAPLQTPSTQAHSTAPSSPVLRTPCVGVQLV